jgi:acyl-coenzyme A thioesterase PaaI-like protein
MTAAPALPHFLTHFGITWELDASGMTGGARLDPQLCLPGSSTPRTAALAILADNAAGYVGAFALDEIAPTIDLSMHVFRAPAEPTVAYTCRPLRRGRRVAVLETWFTTADDLDPWAVSVATFLGTGRPDAAIHAMPTAADPPFTPASALDESLDRRLGITVLAPGVLTLPRRDHVSNGRGTVQGGIVSLLIERACESALGDAGDPLGSTHVVTGLDVRYLGAVRDGPARAEATALRDDDGGGHLWVTVVDAGDDDRLVAHAFVTTRSPR